MKTTLKAVIAAITLTLLTPHAIVMAQKVATPVQSPADELERLQGTWQGIEVGREGDGKCRMTIAGNSLRFEGATKKEWYQATMTLPAGTNPKQLVGAITECPQPDFVGKSAIAIYKVEDGTLTLVGHQPGVPEAPKSFEGGGSSRTFILKKAQPEKDKTAGLPKAEAKPSKASGATPTVEQRFAEADITLAIAHYEKLRNAAFEIRLKLELEQPEDQIQPEVWAKKEAMLRDRAALLRDETIRRAADAGR